MSRRRMVSAFKVAAEARNYEDLAVLPADVDPQVTISRNRIIEPFFHLFEKDTVITQMSGSSVVRMRDSSVNTFSLGPGDHVYMPAGTPHRIEPVEDGVMLRYMDLDAGREGAAWFCEKCGDELVRLEWKHDNDASAPEVYRAACARYNSETAEHPCANCGTPALSVDIRALGWDEEESSGEVVGATAGVVT